MEEEIREAAEGAAVAGPILREDHARRLIRQYRRFRRGRIRQRRRFRRDHPAAAEVRKVQPDPWVLWVRKVFREYQDRLDLQVLWGLG